MTKPKEYSELSVIGRPPNKGPKPVVLNVLVLPAIKRNLKSLAESSELSLSAYVAEILTKHVARKK
jgi:predicted HicB family RNase H-like nuclease